MGKDWKSLYTLISLWDSCAHTHTHTHTAETEFGLDCGQLDEECSEEVLWRIAPLIPDWLEYAEALEMTTQEKNAISEDKDLEYAMKCYELLKKWHYKNGYRAHYRTLVEAFHSLGHTDVAESTCGVIREHYKSTLIPNCIALKI